MYSEKYLTITCKDPFYTYDAYHITGAFCGELVRAGKVRQITDRDLDVLVRITAGSEDGGTEEVFSFADDGTIADRKEVKYRMGLALYDALSHRSGRDLPWGILTGVRPTKIVRRWLEEGMDPKACEARFGQECRVRPDRARLAVATALKEIELFRKAQPSGEEAGICIYVHIPFCPSRCTYCSFASVPADKYAGKIDGYLDALEREMLAAAPHMTDKRVSSIYVGGGTPTVLNDRQLERLCGLSRRACRLPREQKDTGSGHFTEWTVEAGRPDTITPEKLRVLKEAGVSRISINPQSMHDETLARIGRRHSSAQIVDAFRMAREAGFDSINMDLIAGLDGESALDFRKTLEKIEPLAPDSVTVHALAVKRASALGQDSRKSLSDDEEVLKMSEAARVWAAGQGLEPYYLYRQKNISANAENIGFAKPGSECLYNILIMEEVQDILAFGAGAVSKFLAADGPGGQKITRVVNVKDVLLYMQQIDEMIKRKERVLC